ncbi:hypothetical protein LguiA_014895 [Lonicera macranthoides]
MVVISQPSLNNFSFINTTDTLFSEIPIIALSDPNAKTLIVKACEEFGFFKLVNYGVSMDLMARLEAEALEFFNLPQHEKDQTAPPYPFGYGNKRIGHKGDIGWVEYLLFNINPQLDSNKSLSVFPRKQQALWCLINEYISAVRNMACEVLELIADGLEIRPRNMLSKLLRDENSDSIFRLNHYAPWAVDHQLLQEMNGRDLVGFGEHTDPQIISVIKSNNTSGLQICLRDGRWVSVPPDPYSFFISVDDSLQVMTNGRFKSVKHRVLTDCLKSRVSMIYFGGPPLNEKIAPLSSLMERTGEESLYKEFTWSEFMNSNYETRLGDDRLKPFEKP